MKGKILISLIILLSVSAFAQSNGAQNIDWKFLSKVEFEDHYHEEFEAWYLHPVFSEEIKALDKKKVSIKGYVIPLDAEGGMFALSAYPFSACFFCGGAGPESVMSIKFKTPPRNFKTDDVATFSGILHLNEADADEFIYVLKEAKEIEK